MPSRPSVQHDDSETLKLPNDVATAQEHNPLRNLSREQLVEDVTAFHREKELPEDVLQLLIKGALVAQNPATFESLSDIDADEKKALREEVTRRWKHPWALYYTIFLNSIAAAIHGWDQVRFPAVTLTLNVSELLTKRTQCRPALTVPT